MLKVLVVDDELLVRLGIKTTIPWEENGFEIIGEAVNGAEALEMYMDKTPDIIITDIKMPKMDGIELTKKIRELDRNTRIIVLTCYDEFNYMKEAIRLGASDYIIKATMEPRELLNTLVKIRDEIHKELEDLHEVEKLRRELETQRPIIRQRAMADFLKGSLNNEPVCLETKLRDNGIEFIHPHFIILYFEIDDYKTGYATKNAQEKQLIKKSMMNLANEMMGSGYNFITAETEEQDFVCVLSLDVSQTRALEIGKRAAQKIQEAVKNYSAVTVSAAVSKYISSLEDIPFGFEETKGYLNYKMFLGKNCLITYDDARRFESMEYERQFKLNQEELVCTLKEGDIEGVKKLIEDIFSSILVGKKSFIMLEYTCTQLISILNRAIEESNFINPECMDKRYYTIEEVFRLGIFDEIRQWMIEHFIKLAHHIKNNKYNCSNLIIRKAIGFMAENLSKQITLGEVAEFVNISRTYFSQVFKQETGENFVDYLNKLRVETAKRLLVLTDLKTYEIADKTGFQDNSYFCKIFKQVEGVTPTDCRKKNNN